MSELVSSAVQSVDRLFQITELLSESKTGLALGDICNRTGLAKATASRMLSSLITHGYCVQDESRRYKLTVKMFQIGSRVVDRANVLTSAKPYLDELARVTEETVHLVTKLGDEVVYLYKEEGGSSLVRTASFVGLKSPMYCTGVGKSILARLPQKEVEEIWSRSQIVRYTDTTITDLSALQRELQEIRDLGYAIDREEHEKGVFCIAVPILDYNLLPVAAISLSVPVSRMNEDRIRALAPLVIKTAKKISSAY